LNIPAKYASRSWSLPPQFKWLARLAVAGGLLAVIFRYVPLEEVARQFTHVSTMPLMAALTVTVLGRVISAVQFKYLTDIQHMKVSLSRIFYINTVTAFYQLFLPGYISGGAIRWYKLADGAENADKALSVILVARLFDSMVAFIWMLTLFAADTVAWASGYSAAVKLFAGALIAVTLAGFGVKYQQHLGAFLHRRVAGMYLERSGRIAGAIGGAARLLLNFSWLTTPQVAATVLLLSVYHFLGASGWFYLAMGLDIDIPLLSLVWIRIVIYLAMLIPITFSGLGVREGLLILLLAPLGIDAGSAVAFALLLLCLSIAIGVLGGAVEGIALTFGACASRSGKSSD
jgi:hypothetical protein